MSTNNDLIAAELDRLNRIAKQKEQSNGNR